MAVVPVEIRPKPASSPPDPPAPPTVVEPDGAELVEDMDYYLEDVMCSCSAGDDNPY